MARAEKENGVPFSPLRDKINQSILDARRIFIDDAIDSESASDCIRQLWYLKS